MFDRRDGPGRINIVAVPGIRSTREKERHPCVFGNFVKLLKSSAPRSASPRLRFSPGRSIVSACFVFLHECFNETISFPSQRTQYTTFVNFRVDKLVRSFLSFFLSPSSLVLLSRSFSWAISDEGRHQLPLSDYRRRICITHESRSYDGIYILFESR